MSKNVKLTLTGYENFKDVTQNQMADIVKEGANKIRISIINEFTQFEKVGKKNPIDTGHLRNSVGVKEIDKFTYEIGVSTAEKFGDAQFSERKLFTKDYKKKIKSRKDGREYSSYVEDGTGKMKKRPFMKQGVAKVTNGIQRLIADRINKAIELKYKGFDK